MPRNWLSRALEESRARGFLSSQDLKGQIAHARGFYLVWESVRGGPPEKLLDLGSGGGLPGLVLADHWRCHVVLLDSMERRGSLLREVAEMEDAPPRLSVVVARAEDAARFASLEGTFDLVTARSFAPPAVTAECAVRFLAIGGLVIVSDPPGGGEPGRWPEDGLSRLGLRASGHLVGGFSYRVLEKTRETEERYPRSSGVPGRRPLWRCFT